MHSLARMIIDYYTFLLIQSLNFKVVPLNFYWIVPFHFEFLLTIIPNSRYFCLVTKKESFFKKKQKIEEGKEVSCVVKEMSSNAIGKQNSDIEYLEVTYF